MRKALVVWILIFSFLICSQTFAEESSSNQSVSNGSDRSENSNNTETEKPHSGGEIALDVVKGVCSSAAAGVAAANGNVPAAVGGLIIGSEKFIEAAKKYNENIKFEKDNHSAQSEDSDDRYGDQDSWDKEY